MKAKEPLRITKKIVSYTVVTPEEPQVIQEAKQSHFEEAFIELLDTTVTDETIKPLDNSFFERIEALEAKAKLKRPLRLDNEWRLKPPYANHALYVRLNAIECKGSKFPYEIFFNTKDVKDIKWLNALTVTISTAFRTAIETGSSLQTLIGNFKESCDTESPYLSKVTENPKFVNGLVAEIGLVIEVFNNECLAWSYSASSHERPPTEEEKQVVTTFQDTTQFKEFMEDQDTKQSFTEYVAWHGKVITNPCPDCGEQLTKQAGCDMCACGYSKCG